MIILGLILFVLLVVVHEYGHFLAARRSGVEVEEFGIGFPPKIAGKKLGKGIFRAYYTFNLLPLGGFVRLKGESDADKRPGSFGSKSLGTKIKITLAGVAMNFIAAVAIFTLLALVGVPKFPGVCNQFTVPADTQYERSPVSAVFIGEDSPAARAGLQENDEIVSLAGRPVESDCQLFSLTSELAGQNVDITYRREGETQTVPVTLNSENNGGYLGVTPFQNETRRSTWSAPITGVGLTLQLGWMTLAGVGSTLGNLLVGEFGQAGQNVAGPVGIFYALSQIGDLTLLFVLIGLISIALAIMNALPIPALDGGRIAVMLLFRALRKPLSARTEQLIHGVGMVVLLGLVVLITVLDVRRFY